MKKVLIYISFMVVSTVVVLGFVTATSYTQLALATLFYPPLAYMAFRQFPGKKRRVVHLESPMAPVPQSSEAESEDTDALDIDKRAFLKLIGAAGLSFFLFSIFSRRSESLFFGKAAGSEVIALEDPQGNKIHPAEHHPTDGYQISEIDESDPVYCGYVKQGGAWFIMKQDTETGSFRYTKGESNFPDNWSNRGKLQYDYFHNVFS